MEYFILSMFSEEEGGAIIESLPKNGPSEWKYLEGCSLKKQFPVKASIKYSSNYPENRMLHDFVKNILRVLIVSSKVIDLIQKKGGNNVEVLPIELLDHREEIVSDSYGILNLIGSQDIVDMEKSKYKMSSLEKDQIKRVKKLIVSPDKVDQNSVIFRAKKMRKHIFIREDLLQLFVDNGISGLKVYSANGWDGVDI